MGYTKELIQSVKELYPNSPEMHKLAESGNVYLGRWLDDSASLVISIDEVLLSTSLTALQDKARQQKRKVELYDEWCKQDPRKK